MSTTHSKKAKAFLQDEIFAAQSFLEKTGPSFVFVKAVPAVSAVCGIGTVSVGVRVSKAYNVLFHNANTPCILFLEFGKRGGYRALPDSAEFLIRQSEVYP